jgi:predicted amidohydrolase
MAIRAVTDNLSRTELRPTMASVRIALANIRYPSTADEAVHLCESAIAEAGAARSDIICFPETVVPGYRGLGKNPPLPDRDYLTRAWATLGDAARRANVAVLLGTERLAGERLLITTLVINRDGTVAGFQDKVQLDPSEDQAYVAGAGRTLFTVGGLTFGIAICHEGWRYPETVRWAARRGAQVVFVPHFHPAEADGYRPASFADPANTFHEKALLCRAAENTIYIAAANFAGDGTPTTSAFINPDGTVLAYQPYGQEGLLISDLDLAPATRMLAARLRS